MFQFCNNYGWPRTLVNGFRTPAGFRNLATGGFRNPTTLVNGFRNPVTADSGTLPRCHPETELHFFENLQCCFCDWHIHKLYYSCYERGGAKRHLALYTPSPIHLPCSKRHSSLLLLPLIHFLDKQFAKNDRILWKKNILDKLLFRSYNSKWMNKFLYCVYFSFLEIPRTITRVI